MAEEQIQGNESGESSGGASPMKTLLVILAVMLLEGAGIVGFMMMSSGPSEVSGDTLQAELDAQQNKLVEVLVVEERFDNLNSGRTILYDTGIYVKVKKKHEEKVKMNLKESVATIKSEIGQIIRQSEVAQLNEPTKSTLTRRVKKMMDERFGMDESDEPIIGQVLIVKCTPLTRG